jgi:hypothetical protein
MEEEAGGVNGLVLSGGVVSEIGVARSGMRSWQCGDVATYLVVGAFLCLSLCITAYGTARFAVALGYSEMVGYAVGVVLELGKWVLPTRVMSLWHARPRVLACRVLACLIGTACLVLVAYSALATHATVSTAIASRERMGTWQMETRSGAQPELTNIERQLAAISVPQPRPSRSCAWPLSRRRVPRASGGTARSARASATAAIFRRRVTR